MFSLFIRVLDFAVPVLITMFAGLFGTALLIELGLMQKLSRFVSPIFKYTNLPDTCASAFIISMGSTVAANSMVVNFRDKGAIDGKEATLCAVMNSTPAYIREIFTYQIPIVLPALGPVVGGFYVMVFILTGIIKIGIVVLMSKLMLKKRNNRPAETVNNEKVALKVAARRALDRNWKLFTRIAMTYIIMTSLVFYLMDSGAFEVFSVLPLAEIFGIPPESIVPLTSFIASPILGFSMLGPMLSNNGITPIQAMKVLMLGSMFMLPIFSIRTLLPRYMSMFGAGTGIAIVTFSTGISILVRLIILILLLMVAH